MKPSADIHFNDDGVPVSNQFDDIYFSVDSGIDESRYVFIEQNGLPERLTKLPPYYEFVVTETGFGTGLNFLLCWQQFLQSAPKNCRLVFVSFEKFPLSKQQLQLAYRALPELQPMLAQLLSVYPNLDAGCHRLVLADGRVTLDLWLGDIKQQLPRFADQAQHQVDAWFLDGFAPSKNPEMWQPFLFQAMADCAHANTTFATFTAAGIVKRGLAEAGFRYQKVKGFGRKREMLSGQWNNVQKPSREAKKALTQEPVNIIGGGIAAACLAQALQRRGIFVEVTTQAIADGASGNPQGAVYPLLHAEYTPLSQFYLQAFSTAVSIYQPWLNHDWFRSGVLQPAFNPQRQQRSDKIGSGLYSEESVKPVTADDSDQLAGLAIGTTSLHYANAGWMRPASMVHHLLGDVPVHIEAATLPLQQRTVIAAGHHSAKLVQQTTGVTLPIQPVRGQISMVKATSDSEKLAHVLCYKGYMVPADRQQHCIGATFDRDNADETRKPEDDADNLKGLQENSQQQWARSLEVVDSRVSVRATTPDHQPLAGAITDKVWVLSGLGSRGLTSAPLLAEIVAAQLTGGLVPLSADAVARLQPQRFKRRR